MEWFKQLVAAAAARQLAREAAAAACDCDCEEDDESTNAADWSVVEEWQRQPPAHHNGYGTMPDWSVPDESTFACDDPDWCWSAPTLGCEWD